MPEKWREETSFDWLKDPDQCQQAIADITSGKTYDGRPSPLDFRHVSHFQSHDQVLSCGNISVESIEGKTILKTIDEMADDEFFCRKSLWRR